MAATSELPVEALAQHARLFCPETGLPGWALLIDRTTMSLRRSHRMNRHVAVIAFAKINFGTVTPQSLAARFREALRPDDTVARPEERTFVVVCSDITDQSAVDLIVERVLTKAGVVCEVKAAISADEQGEELLARVMTDATRRGTT